MHSISEIHAYFVSFCGGRGVGEGCQVWFFGNYFSNYTFAEKMSELKLWSIRKQAFSTSMTFPQEVAGRSSEKKISGNLQLTRIILKNPLNSLLASFFLHSTFFLLCTIIGRYRGEAPPGVESALPFQKIFVC